MMDGDDIDPDECRIPANLGTKPGFTTLPYDDGQQA